MNSIVRTPLISSGTHCVALVIVGTLVLALPSTPFLLWVLGGQGAARNGCFLPGDLRGRYRSILLVWGWYWVREGVQR